MLRTLLATLIVVLAPHAVAAQQASTRLVGTRRIVEFCDVDTPGDTTYRLDRRPIGFFIYDPNRKGDRR